MHDDLGPMAAVRHCRASALSRCPRDPAMFGQRLGVAACLGHAEAAYPGAQSLPHYMAGDAFAALKTAKGWRAD
jgi:hypothetical protein